MKIQEWLDNRERTLATCTSEAKAIQILQLCPFVQEAMLSDWNWHNDESEAGCRMRIVKCDMTVKELQWAFRKLENVATDVQVKFLTKALSRLCTTFSLMKGEANQTLRKLQKEKANEKGLVER